ncbi:MAG TPA: putative glycolipid-binding domain-containing protein [Gemmatimonadaceae bacterium]|nr:putative glycolipid-binding domain-containing protein [Gemmatimonadaceae bacterium]
MARSLILWRRLDLQGHEFADLTSDGTGWLLSGVALVVHEGRPCRLEYRIECDAAWHTHHVTIRGDVGDVPAQLELSRNAGGEWRANDAIVPAVDSCIDVDLGFSPSTNLLPIRRLGLAVGEHASVRAAWVRFPELTIELLEQTYTRIGETTYLYESAGGAFRRELSVNRDGFVLDYPGLWSAEAATTDDRE